MPPAAATRSHLSVLFMPQASILCCHTFYMPHFPHALPTMCQSQGRHLPHLVRLDLFFKPHPDLVSGAFSVPCQSFSFRKKQKQTTKTQTLLFSSQSSSQCDNPYTRNNPTMGDQYFSSTGVDHQYHHRCPCENEDNTAQTAVM